MSTVETFIDKLAIQYRSSAEGLAAVRMVFALHILTFPVDYVWTARLPSSFFRPPPGPFSLLADPPPIPVVYGLEAARSLLAIMVLLGLFTRAASILLSGCLIAGSGLTHSFGKVDHFILYEIFPVFMAFAGWGARWSVDERRGRGGKSAGFPLVLWAITVGYAMASAALPKMLSGWLDPEREATRGYLARDLADPVKIGLLHGWIFQVESPLFWKLLDFSTVFLEGAVLLSVLIPLLFRLVLLLLAFFHLGVLLTLGIDFTQNLICYVVFFFPAVSFSRLTRLVGDSGA